MRVVHIDRQRGWTGQTQQTFNAVLGLRRLGVDATLIGHDQGELAPRAAAAGLPVVAMPLYGSGFWRSVPRVMAYCKKQRVDVIHCHGPRDHLLATMVRSTRCARRMVRTRHFHKPLNSGLFSRLLFAPCDRIIAISRFVADLCERDGLPARKVQVIYDSIDPQTFAEATPDAELSQRLAALGEPRPVVVGHVSTLEHRKGCDVLLKAVAAAQSRLDQRLIVVLVGQKDGLWRPLVEELGLGESVWFLGRRSDVPSLLKCFDLFVMPSRQEAMGTAALEAMAAGLPVVASRTGGLAEAVTPETGRLFEVEDHAELAAALVELAGDAAQRQSLGQAAAQRAAEVFGLDVTCEQMLAAYRSLLK